MELFNDDADELLLYFVETYPEDPKVQLGYFQLGKYYYRQKRWERAIEWYEKVDPYKLTPKSLAEFRFKKGYSHFHIDEFDEAEKEFLEIRNYKTNYKEPTVYYASHIAYTKGNYQVALEGFYELVDSKGFSSIVPYYITQIYYLQEKYEKVIEYATGLMDSVKVQRESEVAHLIGDAYYKLGQFDEAVPYLETYQKRAQVSREDRYELAYAYYRSKAYFKSIEEFNRVVSFDDSLSQVAYYNMADAYLKIDKKAYAKNAFQAAAKINLDPELQEDALYNYAKLAYELSYNPYDEAIEAFHLYLETYPDSDRKKDVYGYLLNVYLTTKNYEAALKSIERIADMDFQLKKAYQMLSFNLGVEQFHNKRYKQAIDNFKKVKTYPVNLQLNSDSKYWIAECYYKMSQYDKAIVAYKIFRQEPGAFHEGRLNLANYNIGYAYYHQMEYEESINAFRNYVDDKDNKDYRKINDAYLRIADAYYINKDDENAIFFYDKAIDVNVVAVDYALYQKALALGYSQKTEKKIETLSEIIDHHSASRYVVKAKFEMAESYRVLDEREKAIKYYNQVVEQFPDNLLVRQSLLNIALLEYKNGNYSKSEDTYLKVLSKYNQNPEDCKEAIDGLKDVYAAKNQIEQWEALLENYSCAQYSQADLDSTFFNTAMNHLYDGDCDKAVKGFTKYLNKFESGIFTTDANFYRSECLYSQGYKDEALVGYDYVLNKPNNRHTEIALTKAADLYYDHEDYQQALDYYERLKKLATLDENLLKAHIGLMRSHYELSNFKDAIDYSSMVIPNNNVRESTKVEAYLIMGLSYKALDNYDKAIEELELADELTNSEKGAEAKYNIAHIYFLQEDYEKCEKEIYEFVQQKPSYSYWLAKAYLLLADNFAAIGDYFQAKHTLRSIIDNYTGDDKIVEQAEEKLARVIEMESEEDSTPDTRSMEIDNDESGEGEEIYQNLQETGTETKKKDKEPTDDE